MDQQQDASSPSDGAFSKMTIFGIESVWSLDFIKSKKGWTETAATSPRKHKAKHLIRSQASACRII